MKLSDDHIERKTLVGVLASHDSVVKQNELARLLEALYEDESTRKKLEKFHFVFSGGTFQRLVLGEETEQRQSGKEIEPIGRNKDYEKEIINFIKGNATRLPDRKEGGITVMANLVVQGQCSILWSFFSPITVHWLGPENLALMRLCDIWQVKRLMNPASVRAWIECEADRDVERNRQPIPPAILVGMGEQEGSKERDEKHKSKDSKGYYEIVLPKGDDRSHSENWWCDFSGQTIALIAHDEMKARIVDFAIQYEKELAQFGRVLATGATAQAITNACRRLREERKVSQCLPGPNGGDIEIATAVLFNRCETVVFFIDPLNPHPHIEDVRSVFSACMAELKHNDVRMLTNEVQAREWMEEVVRRGPRKHAHHM